VSRSGYCTTSSARSSLDLPSRLRIDGRREFAVELDRHLGEVRHRARLLQSHKNGTKCTMETTIDRAGRLVIPKVLREALGLRPGQKVEIRAADGRLEIAVAATAMRLERRGKGLVAVPQDDVPVLTSEQVRETLERTRR
jgi:AbrB family looped-hinge helix DNA binding protein